MSAVCSKKMLRGKCHRVVRFYAEFHGRRENACAVHLGDILIEQQVRPATVVTVRVRPAAEGGDDQ